MTEGALQGSKHNSIGAATPLNHIGSEAFSLSLFSQTYLRQDFKEVLTDLFCVIAVGLADEPDGIRQQDVAFAFSALYFCHSSYSLFVICFMVVTSLCWNDNLRFLILDIYTKYRHL